MSQIFVKTVSGRVISLDYDSKLSIKAIKDYVNSQEGITVEQQRLIFNGKQLEDDKTLDDYNIGAGSTIALILRLRGGN